MLYPLLPDNEDARLRELRSLRVLDTPDDQNLDNISELARRIAGTEAAVISLVDENRQWFKSCVGLSLQERETPRSISFCAHTILQRTPLVIPDALNDSRFADNPLVVGEPRIRFYAGFPLVSESGYSLGSLCAISSMPCSLTDEQIDSLSRLSDLAIDYLSHLPFRSLKATSDQSVLDCPSSNNEFLSDALGSLGRLLSRDQLLRTIEAAMAMHVDAPFGLLRCAFREYDRVNATFGASVAESYIDEAVRRLLGCCPRVSTMARIAESEVLVLLPFEGQDADIEKLAERIISFVGQPYRSGANSILITVSIGIAISRNDYDSVETLLADTSLAVRMAMRSPASSFRFVDSETRSSAQQTFKLESDLREAVQNGLLEPYLQPIVSLENGEVLGFEALARWSRDGEVLTPASFLSTLLEAGLVGELDLLIIEKALAAVPLLAICIPQKEMVLSVNLSGNLLEDSSLRCRLLRLIDETSLPLGWALQVELLEDAFQDSSADFESFLAELAGRSVSIVIDDFGTGYSSLSRLISLPVQGVKIDRIFVQRLAEVAESPRTLLRTMLSMLSDLGLKITAEGVETDFQCQWLRSQGVGRAQGFMFNPALAVDQAIQLLKSSNYRPSAIPVPQNALRQVRRGRKRRISWWLPFLDRRRSVN